MNPTPQQAAFLSALTTTDRNITLQARAGCGKTTAILMGVDAYSQTFPTHSIHICAFNKAIAVEVQEKLKFHGYTNWQQYSAGTIHSMGMGLLKFVFRNPKVDENKVRSLIRLRADYRYHLDPLYPTYQQYESQINSLVHYAKQGGVGFFDDMGIGDPSVWYKLADHFDVNGFDDTSVMDQVVACAQVIYRDSLDTTNVIDYDDMILFPLIKNLKVKFTKDLLMVDEAQDLSRARQALAKKFMTPRTGRMVVVGDDCQAIYGFSGADAEALHNLTTSLDAITLPLSVTWRCPKTVVAEAQKLVADLEAASEAIDGQVLHTTALPDDLTPGKDLDVILCRNTAPLISLAYELIRSGKACKVEGRKIGEGLINLAQRWKLSQTSALADRLVDYRDREMQKAVAKGNESKAADIDDRVGTLLEIIQVLNKQNKYHISDVIKFIEDLFADGADNVITLATYHRSKGREWNRVILWEHYQRCPSKMAKQQWQKEQEKNLAYVAITRSKDTLIFVTPETDK